MTTATRPTHLLTAEVAAHPVSTDAAELSPDLMRVGEAAAVFGVTTVTIKNWIQLGRFPGAFTTPGGHWRVPKQRVLDLRVASQAAHEMNRSGRITQEVYHGDPLGDLDL